MEMNERNDLLDDIVQLLESNIAETLSSIHVNTDVEAVQLYDRLVNAGYISITPPLEQPRFTHYITMDLLGDFKVGGSIKPGNILLNIRKLIESIPEIVSIGAGIAASNDLIIILLGALGLWLKMKSIATVNISKEQAFVIVALWRNCNSAHKISLDDGFVSTNELLKQYGEIPITNLKYNMVIDSLVKMRCMELTEGTIWLRECISKKYIYSF